MIGKTELAAIVAVDNEWGIGKDGNLPWRLPGDLAYFKEKTLGHAVVMGRRTLESLPGGLLTGRTNIIMTRQTEYATKGATVVHSVQELLKMAETAPENFGGGSPTPCGKNTPKLFIAGGAEIYSLLLPYTDVCLVTKVDTVSNADTFFPNIDADKNFRLTHESEPKTESNITYKFTEYINAQGIANKSSNSTSDWMSFL